MNSGVPLGQYRSIGTGVDLQCRACGQWRHIPLDLAIATLGEAFPVTMVGSRARKPCERCGALDFYSCPAFKPKTGGSGKPHASP